jgi:iron-sulfur cluster assembly protein
MKSKFAVMSLTDAAAERVRTLIANSEKPVTALRVGVRNGGCAGMAYTADFVDEIGAHDEIVEDKGVKIVIDPKALLFLLGTQMDIETTKFRSGFTFRNPNQISACGCGESVELAPADAAKLEAAEG